MIPPGLILLILPSYRQTTPVLEVLSNLKSLVRGSYGIMVLLSSSSDQLNFPREFSVFIVDQAQKLNNTVVCRSVIIMIDINKSFL